MLFHAKYLWELKRTQQSEQITTRRIKFVIMKANVIASP